MSNAAEIRHNHFKQFSRLPPEEQLRWALSAGHSLWQIMPKDSKRYAERLRNGWKKYLSRSKSEEEFNGLLKRARKIKGVEFNFHIASLYDIEKMKKISARAIDLADIALIREKLGKKK